MSDYSKLPIPPAEASIVTVIIHLVDSVGFRYYWATEGLADVHLAFAPAEGAMTLGRQMAHVRRIVQWTNVAMQSKSERVKEVEEDFATMRSGTFAAFDALKSTVTALGPDGLTRVEAFGLPFWNLINGPITDGLTHVGQINTYRRMLGEPARAINFFTGKAG